MNDFVYFEESWNDSIPLRKQKRIKDGIKRNEIKNNRSRQEGSEGTYKGS